jgi:excinuclease ABC subunit A
VLHRLADLGNTVIIIEHNLDVIRNADWILDLGPEGGEDGGRVVGQGRPAKIAATPGSYTGQFLMRYYTSSNGPLEPVGLDADSANDEPATDPDASSSAEGVADKDSSRPKAKRPAAKKASAKATPRKKKTGLP